MLLKVVDRSETFCPQDVIVVVHSGAPVAEGRHGEPHSCRTRAFIFVWSSLSAVNGLRARTYDDDADVAQHDAHTGQLINCIHLCNLILEIHFMVN